MASVALMAFRASLRESGKMQRTFHKSFAPAGGHGHSEVRLPRCCAFSLAQQHIPLCSKTRHHALKRRRECLAVYPPECFFYTAPPKYARNACSDIASSVCPCSVFTTVYLPLSIPPSHAGNRAPGVSTSFSFCRCEPAGCTRVQRHDALCYAALC